MSLDDKLKGFLNTTKHVFLRSALGLSLTVMPTLYNCGSEGGDGPLAYGCQSDKECKGGRICIDNLCQYPPDQPEECIDNDSDGYGINCALGQDCDDNNSSVHQKISCNYNGNFCGEFQLCLNSCPPSPSEICDGLDNNCNNQVDEGCSCNSGETQSCGVSDLGECKKGTQACYNGAWGDCKGAKNPSDEICDEKDNNCDGETDEDDVCVPACTDECSPFKQKKCFGDEGWKECGDYDADECLEWSSLNECWVSQSCNSGECVGGLEGKIVFSSNRDGNQEIYVMNANGSNLKKLTDYPESEECDPKWSPDGNKIAFYSFPSGAGEDSGIFIMDAEGNNIVGLTDNSANDEHPRWSPDGSKIAFASNISGYKQIYVMNSDGSNQQQLTNLTCSSSHLFPDWSPDGSKIAFSSDYEECGGNSEIYTINIDGNGKTKLTDNSAEDSYPVWSPDGSKIAFIYEKNGNFEIYVMNADGSSPKNLTNNTAKDGYPTWSPDGNKIAFCSDREGEYFQIYVMNADGTNIIRITDSQGDNISSSWTFL